MTIMMSNMGMPILSQRRVRELDLGTLQIRRTRPRYSATIVFLSRDTTVGLCVR